MSTTTLTAAEIAERDALAAAVRPLDVAPLLVPEQETQAAAVLGAVLAAVGELARVQSQMLVRQRAQGDALAALVLHGQASLPAVSVVME